MRNVGKWVDRLFNKHKFVRRLLVFWAAALITWVIVTVFTQLELINGHVVTALSIVVGLLATAIGFYKFQRAQDQMERLDDCDNSDVDGS